MLNYYNLFKHIAFKVDPETIHDLSIQLMSKGEIISPVLGRKSSNYDLSLKIKNLDWSFPVGLAAGFDKNAMAFPFLSKLGFGSIEVGTVTLKAQKGNPRPRIFRHKKANTIQNAMGFPNHGCTAVKDSINSKTKNTCLGINIGKNKNTTENDAPAEYAKLYKELAPLGDYIVINISSPNTPGLRSFQKMDLIKPLVDAVKSEQANLHRPLFIKISPDMDTEDIKNLCELSKQENLSGIIATNTTIQHDLGVGGVSGDPLKAIAPRTRKIACEILKEDPTQQVIGVGGISTFDEIKEFWKDGGGFVQIYTSFIYHGPHLLQKIQNDIIKDLKKHKLQSVSQLRDLISNSKNA